MNDLEAQTILYVFVSVHEIYHTGQPICSAEIMPDMSDITPGFAQYNGGDHTAWLLVASFVLILITILVTVVRMLWRHRITRSLLSDDWLVLIATVCYSIGESVVLQLIDTVR
jgi:hypothetical protein